MSNFSDRVQNNITNVLTPEWNVTEATEVPETDDVVLRNGAKEIDATYLYADMANSTKLAQEYTKKQVGKVIRSYLNAATTILRWKGGEIRSFDGDRVMAIFIGESKNSSAVIAAAHLEWAVSQVMRQRFKDKWERFTWEVHQGIGIDTGKAFIVRGGVRGSNDLVSIGSAPNVAAKLSEVRDGYATHMTSAVYSKLNEEAKYYKDGKKLAWSALESREYAGRTYKVYGGGYWREP